MSSVSVVKEGIGLRRLVVNNLDDRSAVSLFRQKQGAVDPMTASDLFSSLENGIVNMTGCHLKLDSASITSVSI